MDDELIGRELLNAIGPATYEYRRWLGEQEYGLTVTPLNAEKFIVALDAVADRLEPFSPDAVRVWRDDDLWPMAHRLIEWSKDAATVGVWTEENVRLSAARMRVIGELGRLRVWRTPDGEIEVLPIDAEAPDYPPANL